ncbi:uncharacterized protein METZ01_LOCUS75970, partial [marine metagenome]
VLPVVSAVVINDSLVTVGDSGGKFQAISRAWNLLPPPCFGVLVRIVR